MHTRLALVPLVVALALTTVMVSGCSHPADPAGAAASPTAAAPRLGGTTPRPEAPPTVPMDALERQVHERLAAQVDRQGLTLTYLDCPRWNERVPSRMTCHAYVDGLVAGVVVHLKAAVAGKAVGFDARMLGGVIATRKLEQTLRQQGWTEADCGAAAAYPARVGSRIVCRVRRTGDQRYMVATVSNRSGAVMIADYRPAKP